MVVFWLCVSGWVSAEATGPVCCIRMVASCCPWSAGDGEDAGGSVARLGVEFWPMLRPSCSCAARAGVSAGNAYNKKSFQIRN